MEWFNQGSVYLTNDQRLVLNDDWGLTFGFN